MHADRALCYAVDFESGPGKCHSHGYKEEQCKHYFGGRVSFGQFPET